MLAAARSGNPRGGAVRERPLYVADQDMARLQLTLPAGRPANVPARATIGSAWSFKASACKGCTPAVCPTWQAVALSLITARQFLALYERQLRFGKSAALTAPRA